MTGNNPNQNQRLEQNHPKGDPKGFAGMNDELDNSSREPRSTQDVNLTRKENVERSKAKAGRDGDGEADEPNT